MTLKIERSAKEDLEVFTLTGRIQVEQVAELEALMNCGATGRNIVLDLKEIKLVDRGAVRFLARCEAAGTRLQNCPGYIREWILQEQNGT